MAVIIDGKKIAQEIIDEVKAEALRLKERVGIIPGLAVLLVGNDPASKIYIRHKENACKAAAFFSRNSNFHKTRVRRRSLLSSVNLTMTRKSMAS